MKADANDAPIDAAELVRRLGSRAVVFVGIMGAGKTAVGRRTAAALGLPFVDSDQEIEKVSRMTIAELFERYGEPEFRALESRVLHRLLEEGPRVVSTGGGAFMNAEIRAAIVRHGISVWLNADIDTLMERVAKKHDRPLLQAPDPRAVMRNLMAARYPVYAQADVTVVSRNERKETIADEAIASLARYLGLAEPARQDS